MLILLRYGYLQFLKASKKKIHGISCKLKKVFTFLFAFNKFHKKQLSTIDYVVTAVVGKYVDI